MESAPRPAEKYMRPRLDLFGALLTVSGFTLLSRITGLMRETLIARAFGANLTTDAFNIAFRIPNLLRRLCAEGAFSQAFVPVLAEFKNQYGQNATKALIDATATVLTWALALLCIIGVAGAAWIVLAVATGLQQDAVAFSAAVWMTRVMFPYIALISLTALASGVLNTYQHFSLPASAPVLLNLSFIVASLWIAPHLQMPVYALAYAVIVGGILQLAVQIPALARLRMLPKIGMNPLKALAHRGVKRILMKMAPAAFAVSVSQLSLIINTNIASRLAPGSVTWLSYADRLMEFPSALLGVALGTVLLPNLAKAHAVSSPKEYSALIDWGLRLTLLLATPSAIALFIYAEPLVAVLYHYGRFDALDVAMVSRALAAYGAGLVGLILIKILAPGFYAKQDIKTPVQIALLVLGITQACNLFFVPYLAHAGLSLSIGIGASINALLLLIGLRKRGFYQPAPGWTKFLVQLVLACGALTAVLLGFRRYADWIALGQTPMIRMFLLAASLITTAALYFGVLWLSGFRYAALRTYSPVQPIQND
ncbi:Virulence factor MviN homolog [Candidatus Glomeribacter gigasporarum BEG34]|uniref:Probable lipid II flippase MurJ n=1 Tax=Candidatus Glomeribacter gigasporarum BEG34 TaxID=1070319 RepID=G2J8T5_9BURK|nr:Virulence factor MviN homolog [Candidatus Glomeribacter gigasporarum BEG34]